MNEQSDQRSQLLGSLMQLSTTLISVLDPEELVTSLISQIVGVLPAVQGGILWMHESRSDTLRFASAYNLPIDQATLEELHFVQLRVSETRQGMVFRRGEPLLFEMRHVSREPFIRLNPRVQLFLQQIRDQLPVTTSVVFLPLQVGSEAIGLLELYNYGQQPGLRPDDMPILQSFGNLVAAAIRNSQLYAQTQINRRRLQAFDAVGTAISTAADLDDLVRSVLDVIAALVSVEHGALLLHNPAKMRLEMGSYLGLPASVLENMISMPIQGAPCEEVVRYGQPVFRPLLEERGETSLLEEDLVSGAYLPLLAGGTVIGVLAIYGDRSLHERIDTATMMPLCSLIGFAIANVKLYEDSQLERRRLNTVINSIAEGVVLCDSQGRLSLANEAAMALLTLDAIPYEQTLSEMTDFYGMRDIEHGQPLPIDELPLKRALSGEVFHDYRVLVRGASGRDSVMSFSGAPARADDNTIEGAVVIFRDITASQRLERAKDEFLAVAAHELRSPLAAVRGYADMLLRREQQRGEEDSKDLRGLTTLSQQVTHMLRMVDNLLDVSRLDAGQLDLQHQHVDLIALVEAVIDQQRLSSNTHELILAAQPSELWLWCDPLRIRQVLTNLIGNAVRYSPNGSRVVISVGYERGEQEAYALNGLPEETHPNDGTAVVAVIDEGNGISEEHRAKLFQRYYRGASRRAEGLGLGLYLSREFVLRHNGQIWVESSEGRGSTFYFKLPINPIEADQSFDE